MSVKSELDEQSPMFRKRPGSATKGQQMLDLGRKALCLAANRA